MTQDASSAPTQPSRIRSITIFAVMVAASISGAAFAQFTALADPPPPGLAQPDSPAALDGPLAFGQK